jgi:hypothetical protein
MEFLKPHLAKRSLCVVGCLERAGLDKALSSHIAALDEKNQRIKKKSKDMKRNLIGLKFGKNVYYDLYSQWRVVVLKSKPYTGFECVSRAAFISWIFNQEHFIGIWIPEKNALITGDLGGLIPKEQN